MPKPASYTAVPPSAERRNLSLGELLVLASVTLSSIVTIEPAPTDILLIAALAALLTRAVRTGTSLLVCAALLIPILFICFHLVGSLGISEQPNLLRHLPTRIYMCLIFFTFYVYVAGASERGLRYLTTAFILSALVCAMVVVLAKFHLVPNWQHFYRDEYMTRLRGTFKDPNVMGPYLALAILFVSARIYVGIHSSRWWAPLVLTIMGGALLLSGSRGAVLVAGVSAVFFFGLALASRRLEPRPLRTLAIISLIGLLAIGGSALIVATSNSADQLIGRASMQSYDGERFAAQAEGFQKAFSHPLGHGAGAALEAFMGGGGVRSVDPHNVYVKIAYEGGVPALAIFLLWNVLAVLFALQVFAQTTSRIEMVIAAIAASTLLAHAVIGFFVDTTHWRHLYLLLGVAFGLRARLAPALRSQWQLSQSDPMPSNLMSRTRAPRYA